MPICAKQRFWMVRLFDMLSLGVTSLTLLTDMKLHLATTDYGDFLQNEPSPLHTTTIAEKCTEKLVSEFQYLRAHAVEPLTTFLDYIT